MARVSSSKRLLASLSFMSVSTLASLSGKVSRNLRRGKRQGPKSICQRKDSDALVQLLNRDTLEARVAAKKAKLIASIVDGLEGFVVDVPTPSGELFSPALSHTRTRTC